LKEKKGVLVGRCFQDTGKKKLDLGLNAGKKVEKDETRSDRADAA